MRRIVNLFAGPGTGKSTTAAALFAACKYRGWNTEVIPEFAKDAAWEGRGAKFFNAQSHIFGQQYFRVVSLIDEVDFAITDSPLLLQTAYVPDNYAAPSIKQVALEHHNAIESINIFLRRNKPYNSKGRYQNEQEAKVLDEKLRNILQQNNVPYYELEYGRDNPDQIIKLMAEKGWVPQKVSNVITMDQRFQWIAENPERFATLRTVTITTVGYKGGYDIMDAIDERILNDQVQGTP